MRADNEQTIPGPAGGAVWEHQDHGIWGETKILIDSPNKLTLKFIRGEDILGHISLDDDDNDKWM